LEALRATPKLPAVHGQHNDVSVWFPDQSKLINMRRFQECSYHLLLAAGIANAATAFNLYTLAYDELFGITPILCSCILGLGSDLLQRMEDFKSARRSHLFQQLPPAARDRAEQYFLFFSSNFQSISLHPRRELLAIATETSTKDSGAVSHVRDDAFAVVRGDGFVKSQSSSSSSSMPHLPPFPPSSIAHLSRLFSPPMAEPMRWPPTLPDAAVSAIAISPCSQHVVCLCGGGGATAEGGSGGGGGGGQYGVFNVLRCGVKEPQFSVMALEIEAADVHLSKRIALFHAGEQPPVLACAVGFKVCVCVVVSVCSRFQVCCHRLTPSPNPRHAAHARSRQSHVIHSSVTRHSFISHASFIHQSHSIHTTVTRHSPTIPGVLLQSVSNRRRLRQTLQTTGA